MSNLRVCSLPRALEVPLYVGFSPLKFVWLNIFLNEGKRSLNKTFSIVGHVTILCFFRSLGLNLLKDWNILASVTHVHESAGGSFLLGWLQL